MPSPNSDSGSHDKDHAREKQALENVLQSLTFADMPRLRRFLDYVVTETIAGNGERLKGVVIACDVFDKDDPDEAQSTTIVRVEAGRLRRRLAEYYNEEGREDPVRIRIPKGGYSAVFEDATEISGDTDGGEGPAGTPGNPRWIRILIITLAVTIGLVAVLEFIGDKSPTTDNSIDVFPDSRPLIAVLPFRNMVSNDTDDSIAYGLTEDIITGLGELPTLEVISITSVLPFKDMDINPLDIHEKLGAHYVLNGSVRGEPPDLRVSAQLHDVVNGVQMWAGRFDRQMNNEVQLQDELARQVVESLSVRLEDEDFESIPQRGDTDTDTWFLYKQAMNMVNPPNDPVRMNLSLQVFEQIMQRDETFAGGFAGAAYVHSLKAFFRHGPDIENEILAALELAGLAQQLDPHFGLSFSAQAFAYLSERKFDEALAASEQAVRFYPNDPYVMAYHGFILCATGEMENSHTFVETALRLDPLFVRTPYLNILGVIRFQKREYESALKSFLRNRDRGGPSNPIIHYFIAATYQALGDNDKAAGSLDVAELMTESNSSFNLESWVRGTWKHEKDAEHMLALVESIPGSESRDRVNRPKR